MAAALLLWCCAALLAPLSLSQTLDPSPAPPSEGCPGPTVSGVLCYLSTECRGGVVPGDGGTVSTVAECCGGARRGLSYCDEEGCENCFSEESYTSSGTEFYLGFFNNLRFRSRLSMANFRVQITSDDLESAQVRITYDGNEDGTLVTVEPGETVSVPIDLPSGDIGIGDRDRAVVVRSTNGQRITVAGLGEEVTSSDSFCILPNVFLPTAYEYYAVSVPQIQVPSLSDGVQEVIVPEEKSAFMIITSEDSTQLSITLTQPVPTDDAEDLEQFGEVINRGETISLTLDAEETLYIASIDDLTGSRVVADKPITFLSGHECGTIPQVQNYCDQLVEEIPPTATWGSEFLTAPFLTREGGHELLALASENDTTVSVFCTMDDSPIRQFSFGLNAGESRNVSVSSFEYCRVVSTGPILLVQFSLASGVDGNLNADPFMVLIPALQQYRSSLSFQVFETLASFNETHYINIFLPGDFDTGGVLLNNQTIPADVWETIACDDDTRVDREVCGFVSRLEISSESQTVRHIDPDARMAVIVYSLAFRTGRGFSAGMSLLPIALDTVSLSEDDYSVLESEEQLVLNITRTGRAVGPLSLLLRSRALSTESSAQVGEDFLAVQQTVTFVSRQMIATVTVPLAPDDVFLEPDKTFELFLGATEGVFVSPFAAATVTILNDDPELPVMEVRFGEILSFVEEGEGVLDVNLVKSSGAVGPVQVRLFTMSDTAMEERDYQPIDVVVTFEVDEMQKSEQIRIFDDRFVEDFESFRLILEPINNLDDGAFPVVVIDDTFFVSITDNDVVVIGYLSTPCRTEEGVGRLDLQVGVLSGVLERNLSIQIETFSGSATADEDFNQTSEVLTIHPDITFSFISVPIINDSRIEQTEFFMLILSPAELDNELGNVVLVNSVTRVFIEDDDDAVIALSVTPGQVAEGGVAMVTLSVSGGQLGEEVEVLVSTIDGNATGGIDFVSLSEVPLFPGGSLLIRIFDNAVFEGDKIFSVVAELITIGQVGLSPSVVTVTIIENEQPPQVRCYLTQGSCLERDEESVRLSTMRDCCLLLRAESFSFPNDPTGLCHDCIVIGFNRSEFRLAESNISYSLTVDVRSGFLPQSLTLGLETVPGSASPEDYSVPSTLTILTNPTNPEFVPSAQLLVTLPQELISDDQDLESFRINILDSFGIAPSNMFFQGTVVTISDFETIVGFLRTLYVVEEGINSTLALDIVILPPATQPLIITLRFLSGTAQVGRDVILPVDNSDSLSFTIPSGVSMVTTPAIEIVEDRVFERDESFFAEITSLSSGVLGTGSTQIEIIDSDGVQMGFLESDIFDGSAYSAVEEEETVEISVGVIEGSLGREVEILVTTIDLTALGGVDYVSESRILTFDPQNQRVTFNLTLIDDDIDDNFELFDVRLSLTMDLPRVVLFPNFRTVIISDSDQPPDLGLRFAQTSLTVSEGQGRVSIPVLLDDVSLEPIVVQIAVIPGTALGNLDYVEPEVGAVFRAEPESEVVNVEVGIREDELLEESEFFIVRLIPGQNQVIDPENSQVTVTIIDNDFAQVRFQQDVYTVMEGVNTQLLLSVSVVTGTLGFDLSFTARPVDEDDGGSANFDDFLLNDGGTAFVGVDYQNFSVNGQFDLPVTNFSFSITILDDLEVEEVEDFIVTVVTRSDVNVTFGEARVVIFDDDVALPQVGFLNSSLSVSEFSELGGEIVLISSGPSPTDSLITVQVEYISGTANVEEDIFRISTNVTISPESLTGVIFINPIFDETFELAEETFIVVLVAASGAEVDEENSEIIVTIIDGDRLFIGGGAFGRTRENETTILLNLEIFQFTDLNVTLFVSTLNTSSTNLDIPFATPEEDYTPLDNLPVVIPAGSFRRMSIPLDIVIDDNITENIEERLRLSVTPEDTERVILELALTPIIVDDDALVIGFSQTVYTTLEGNPTFSVTVEIISGILDEGVSAIVRVATRDIEDDGAATGGQDYDAIDRNIRFLTTQTSVQIPIGINSGDYSYSGQEQNERFEVVLTTLSANVLVNLRPSLATVTILDVLEEM